MKYWWEREPSFMDKRKVDLWIRAHGLGWTIIAQRLLVASFIVLFAWPMISPTFCENVKCRGHNGLAPRKECLPENASGKVAPVCKPSLRVGHVEPVRPNAMNFIAGQSPSDPLDEVFPKVSFIRCWREATGSHGQAQPSAQAGFGCGDFARHLRGLARRRN
jgi:hypothetical protein